MRIISVYILASFSCAWGSQRIINGSLTTIERYPYLASLQQDIGGKFFHSCGATILNDHAVLTAAHCIVDYFGHILPAKSFRLRVGSSFSNSEGALHQIKRFISHDFDQKTGVNDLAMVLVVPPMVFNPRVARAQIAGPSYVVNEGEEIVAVGWGRTDYYSAASLQLHHATLQAITNHDCQLLPTHHPITNDMICIADKGFQQTVCAGDSGSPLIHRGTVVSLVSTSGNRCGPSLPTVGPRLSVYTEWILNAMQELQDSWVKV